jgi:hypothetical protein
VRAGDDFKRNEAIVEVVSDREPATTPGLVSLRPQPPRVVPLGHLWMTAFETRRLSATATALTAAFAMFEFAAGREDHLALTVRHVVPIALASSAALCWGVLLSGVNRARQLLVHGVRCSARITAVAASHAPSTRRSTRVRVRYLANLHGHEVGSSVVLRLNAQEPPPVEGDSLALVCDGSDPTRHLVPRSLGFVLEGD